MYSSPCSKHFACITSCNFKTHSRDRYHRCSHDPDFTDEDTEAWACQWLRSKRILLSIQETWVPSLGREYPLEKGMVTHSSIFVWEIPWTKNPGGL